MKDIMGLMKQAQAMQARMQAMQTELEQTLVEGEAGGGMVKVTLSARGDMRNLSIDAGLLRPDEKEIVEDLIVTAYADARRKAERLAEDKMQSVTAGLPLPPGMKLPF